MKIDREELPGHRSGGWEKYKTFAKLSGPVGCKVP